MAIRPDVKLLVGTTKGLFILDRSGEINPPAFIGNTVPIANYDPRSKRMLAGTTSFFWGTGIATSDDLGKTWSVPEKPNLQFPADTEASIKAAWQIVPASKDEPDVIYVGVEPAALFKSTDSASADVAARRRRALPTHDRARPARHPEAADRNLHRRRVPKQ
jgi:hypothetical protein